MTTAMHALALYAVEAAMAAAAALIVIPPLWRARRGARRLERDSAREALLEALRAERRETGLDAWETVLSIADDGVGIPAADVGRVFDKGFTGENGRRFARSTGMGLYLVRELCAKMGVNVWLESEEGAGTTVFLAFPDSVDRA